MEQAERSAATVASIQLARLHARLRAAGGGAVNERSRRVPGLPRRLRSKGLKRKRQAVTTAGEPQKPEVMGELTLQAEPQDLPSQEV